jgi:ribosomal protein S18 acetylase RimI-like enzyme
MPGPWQPTDVAGAAELLAAAYGTSGAAFAPNNQPEEWRRYVRNLVEQTAVGELLPASTCVLRDGDRLAALVLVTRIASTTAHLAQVAVHPDWRRRKLAATLVDCACARAAAEGCRLATLLVSAGNAPARALYDRLGFRAVGAFVAASRPCQPRRLTSVA